MEPDAGDVQVELAHADGGVETLNPGIVIDAGGAHSMTRRSMGLPLGGTTYQGHFLVADIAMEAPVARDQGSFFCGPEGMMRLAPLPGGRWSGLVEVCHDPGVDPVRAGVPKGGVVLIRPDGHIGFRSPLADAGGLAALESHLSSYLTPPA